METPRTVYWDTALVVDNLIPEDMLSKMVEDVRDDAINLIEDVVTGTPTDDTEYKASENNSFDYVLDWVLGQDLLPTLEGHEISGVARHHRLEKGGKMAWHEDHMYSIAVSVYLTSCVGGEIQICKNCGTQSVLVEPKPNRIIVMKCDSYHRVLEVLDGERESIQIFLKYIKLNGE